MSPIDIRILDKIMRITTHHKLKKKQLLITLIIDNDQRGLLEL